jgi:hypothetical protein
MGKLLFGMMQSLDGYIAGTPGGPQLPPPGPELHRHFNDHVRGLAGIFYPCKPRNAILAASSV